MLKEIERGIRQRVVEKALKRQKSPELLEERDKIESESSPSTVQPVIDIQITNNESISSDPRKTAEHFSSDSTDSSLYLSLPIADTSKTPTTPLNQSGKRLPVTSTPLQAGSKAHTHVDLSEISRTGEVSGEAEKPSNPTLPALLSLLLRFYLEQNGETTSSSPSENFHDDYTEDIPPAPVVKNNIFSSRQCLTYKTDNCPY